MANALIFPGQGSQYSGIGKDAYQLSNFSKDIYKTANEILEYDIKEITFNATAEILSNTKYSQPTIFIYSILASYYLQDNNVSFDMVAGHSLGEISALTVAKSISFEDALKIIKVRASSMEISGLKNPGKMLALINANDKQINEICKIPSIVVANINSHSQIVVAGKEKDIKEAISLANKLNIKKVVQINVSGAFHSPLMKDVTEDLEEVLDTVNFKDAIVPVYQNATSRLEVKAKILKENLLRQIEYPVNWVKIINNMDDNNANLYIETGPGNVLQGLNKRITKSKTISYYEI